MLGRVRIPLVQIGKESLYYLSSSEIFLHDQKGEHKIFKLKEPGYKSLLLRSRLLMRLFRLIPRGVCLSHDRYMIFSLGKKIYIIDVKKQQLCSCYPIRQGFGNPLNIIPDNDSLDYIAYYGDYGRNSELQAVNVYGITKGFLPKVLFTFKGGEIRHIHNIVQDGMSGDYFVFTGDHGNGAGIYKFDNQFQQYEKILSGHQGYRAVQGVVYDNRLYYATDAVMEQNYIFRVNFMRPDIQTEPVQEICGSCIYGSPFKDGYIFSSCVEANEELHGKLRKLLTNQIGAGIKDRYVRLYYIDRWENVQELVRLEKDGWPISLFQYGTVLFPYLVGETDRIYCLPISVKRYDLKLSMIKQEESHGSVFTVCSENF